MLYEDCSAQIERLPEVYGHSTQNTFPLLDDHKVFRATIEQS